MRLSFCFAAMIVAPYATATSHAQAAPSEAPASSQVSYQTPPSAEATRSDPAEVDQRRLIQHSLRVGKRTIMVDQFVGS